MGRKYSYSRRFLEIGLFERSSRAAGTKHFFLRGRHDQIPKEWRHYEDKGTALLGFDTRNIVHRGVEVFHAQPRTLSSIREENELLSSEAKIRTWGTFE